MTVGYSQTKSFDQLEQKIYQLNNKLKYNESQALLLPILQNERSGAEDKYQAALLLSYTYKRIFDYQSTLKFLKIARTFAESSPKMAHNRNTILAEEAFVYFDKHSYRTSDSLIRFLEKAGFSYVSLENKSKLVMQQGYILFLNKQYQQAEHTYDKAIRMMRESTPCHLPMIYVKKMQLYSAMNRFDLLNEALKESGSYADSCHITKYHLYAYEELKKIYADRNDLPQMAKIQKNLDSINTIYAREEYTASLHDQKENILLDDKLQEITHERISKDYLVIFIAGLFIIFIVLLLFYHQQQRRKEIELNKMRDEIKSYINLTKKVQLDKINLPTDNNVSELSGRQREVLELMATGISNKVMADKLFISENTVKYHIKNIYQLLKIEDRKKFLASLNR